jgi:hypothetical protein
LNEEPYFTYGKGYEVALLAFENVEVTDAARNVTPCNIPTVFSRKSKWRM